MAVTALGATLSESHPQSVHGIAVGGMHLHYRAVAELRHTLRTGESAASKYFGKPYFDHVATDPPLAALFGRAMAVFARTLRAGTFDDYRLPAGELIADTAAETAPSSRNCCTWTIGLTGGESSSTSRASSRLRMRCSPPLD